MTFQGMNRYQAFAIHIAISLVIFFILLVCITQHWYPGILFDSSNGMKAVGLIVGIDLILGPLLTLIVFNPKKSSLPFDLTAIAVVQILALAYGTWTIHSSRPLAIAYVNTSFITLYANAKNAEEVQQRVKELNTNQLYYIFNDNKPSESLNVNQFDSYSTHAAAVTLIQSAYTIKSSSGEELLIQIDPLASSNRYLAINKNDGKIIEFTTDSKY
jgi:hypothetical protein